MPSLRGAWCRSRSKRAYSGPELSAQHQGGARPSFRWQISKQKNFYQLTSENFYQARCTDEIFTLRDQRAAPPSKKKGRGGGGGVAGAQSGNKGPDSRGEKLHVHHGGGGGGRGGGRGVGDGVGKEDGGGGGWAEGDVVGYRVCHLPPRLLLFVYEGVVAVNFFSKVLCIVILYRKYTWALTFEDFCQGLVCLSLVLVSVRSHAAQVCVCCVCAVCVCLVCVCVCVCVSLVFLSVRSHATQVFM